MFYQAGLGKRPEVGRNIHEQNACSIKTSSIKKKAREPGILTPDSIAVRI